MPGTAATSRSDGTEIAKDLSTDVATMRPGEWPQARGEGAKRAVPHEIRQHGRGHRDDAAAVTSVTRDTATNAMRYLKARILDPTTGALQEILASEQRHRCTEA